MFKNCSFSYLMFFQQSFINMQIFYNITYESTRKRLYNVSFILYCDLVQLHTVCVLFFLLILIICIWRMSSLWQRYKYLWKEKNIKFPSALYFLHVFSFRITSMYGMHEIFLLNCNKERKEKKKHYVYYVYFYSGS